MTALSHHVFVSYVTEDAVPVADLCAALLAAGVDVWRDRTALGPGDDWRRTIREAIRADALVFAACFSDRSRARIKSYMNEEITLAVDEFRLRPPGLTWIIPIRLDAGPIPDWDLGAGRLLSDLNRVDLFGDDHQQQLDALVERVLAMNARG